MQQVMSGQRNLSQFRASVDRMAGIPPQDCSYVNDSPYLSDPNALKMRIEAIFANRGVPLDYFG